MVYSAKSDDINTISQFTRRKDITITTVGTSTPVNYQVKLTITYEPEMQADFDDIRFNAKAGTYIDYWIESKTNSVTATVWVELPDAIADPGSVSIWMYYGNSGLSDGGNIGNTFIFGDDFEWDDAVTNHGYTVESGSHATSTNQSKSGSRSLYVGSGGSGGIKTSTNWITDNVILELDFYDTHPAGATSSVYAGILDGSNYNGVTADNTNANYYRLRYGVVAYVTSTVSRSIGWHNVKQIHTTNGDIDTYIDDVFVTTKTNVIPPAYIRFYAFDDWYADNLRIRKYIANEPTISYGTAQHQRRVPQFMN